MISDNCDFSDSHRLQTCNLLIRSQMLYSVELANHFCFASAKLGNIFERTKYLHKKITLRSSFY